MTELTEVEVHQARKACPMEKKAIKLLTVLMQITAQVKVERTKAVHTEMENFAYNAWTRSLEPQIKLNIQPYGTGKDQTQKP